MPKIIHPYVEDYWIEELPNGVIHLLFNCKQREIYYHAYNDTMYLISGIEEDENPESVIEIPKFLQKDKYFMYLQTSMKEKEQISFYFIPYQKEWIKNRKFLIG